MVFPEANSYGVPVITTRTGDVPHVVHEGVNGHLLPVEATADAYADLIWRDLVGPLRLPAFAGVILGAFQSSA